MTSLLRTYDITGNYFYNCYSRSSDTLNEFWGNTLGNEKFSYWLDYKNLCLDHSAYLLDHLGCCCWLEEILCWHQLNQKKFLLIWFLILWVDLASLGQLVYEHILICLVKNLLDPLLVILNLVLTLKIFFKLLKTSFIC